MYWLFVRLWAGCRATDGLKASVTMNGLVASEDEHLQTALSECVMMIGRVHTVWDNGTTLHSVIYYPQLETSCLHICRLDAVRLELICGLCPVWIKDYGLLPEVTWFSVTRGSNTHQGSRLGSSSFQCQNGSRWCRWHCSDVSQLHFSLNQQNVSVWLTEGEIFCSLMSGNRRAVQVSVECFLQLTDFPVPHV